EQMKRLVAQAMEEGAVNLSTAFTVAAVRAVCLAGELMPEKSTYFYPKLASGLVFDLIANP
ncbi:MAG TPA: hypothetical protein VJ419_06865, partial [Gaiellaceae bacterium]|nr:hypothetical protein [Gaiellaceae bacterium]